LKKKERDNSFRKIALFSLKLMGRLMKTKYYGYFYDDSGEPAVIVRFQDGQAIMLRSDGVSSNSLCIYYEIITGNLGGDLQNITEEKAKAFQAKWNVSFPEKK